MAFASLSTDVGRHIANTQEVSEFVKRLFEGLEIPAQIDFRSFCNGDLTNWTIDRLRALYPTT
jgi:hypothetical protein